MIKTNYISATESQYITSTGSQVAKYTRTDEEAAEALADEITAATEALVNGRTGGPTEMALFSALNHVAGTYTRNANLWCKDLVPQLTGCCIAKHYNLPSGFHGWEEARGGIRITPRHSLQCHHGEIRWKYSDEPTIYRFVDVDGNPVDMIGAASSNDPFVQFPPLDLVVTLMDDEFPASIRSFPMIELNPNTWNTLPFYGSGAPQLVMSQGARASVPTQKVMIWIYPNSAQASPYPYAFGNGDSGSPMWYLFNGVLYLSEILSGGSTIGLLDDVDALIAQCDANAVASSALEEPTGYTVTRFTNPYLS